MKAIALALVIALAAAPQAPTPDAKGQSCCPRTRPGRDHRYADRRRDRDADDVGRERAPPRPGVAERVDHRGRLFRRSESRCRANTPYRRRHSATPETPILSTLPTCRTASVLRPSPFVCGNRARSPARLSTSTGKPSQACSSPSLRRTVAAGRVMLQSEGSGQTDDRGIYRIAQLPPGNYAVGVLQTAVSLPADMVAESGPPGTRSPAIPCHAALRLSALER